MSAIKRLKETARKLNRRGLSPIALAAVVAVGGACIAFFFSSRMSASWKLHDVLQQAAVGLLFVALLGGMVKLLLDDYARGRDERVEQERFVRESLEDVKAVYDRVERVRVLIPAHRSALTYGQELRDAITAQVQLRNVIRALDLQTSGMSEQTTKRVHLALDAMDAYLGGLLTEYQRKYKRISDLQNAYEAQVKKARGDADVGSGAPPVENLPWVEIAKLPQMAGFIGDWSDAENLPPSTVVPQPYKLNFTDPLDLACWLLRSEIKHPGADHELPDRAGRDGQYAKTLARLESARTAETPTVPAAMTQPEVGAA